MMEYLINFFADHPQSVGLLIATILGMSAVLLAEGIAAIISYCMNTKTRRWKKQIGQWQRELKRRRKEYDNTFSERDVCSRWNSSEQSFDVDMIEINGKEPRYD